MRIEKVRAYAFGPLVDETLELAPGMTVVAGLNESAKSSWHAAVYAALCGRRRGKGATSLEDRRFAAAHKPWDCDGWDVGAELVLDDGRRIEMRQDLEGNVNCRATDVALARDVSAEIMFDGAPDASIWLGLNRASFRATACVDQAAMLGVLKSADGLQTYLQRAAATAGTDATAAAALATLEAFGRDNVGRDQANSTKPLHKARVALEQARRALADARSKHEQYLLLVEQAETLRGRAATSAATAKQAGAELAMLRDAHAAAEQAEQATAKAGAAHRAAIDAATESDRQYRRLEQIRTVEQRLGGREPQGAAADSEFARQVAGALAAWAQLPAPAVLDGQNATALQATIDALPPLPEHDLEVHHDVRAARSRLEQATAVLDDHDRHRPTAPPLSLPPDEARNGLVDASPADLQAAHGAELAVAHAAGPGTVRELAAELRGLPAVPAEPDRSRQAQAQAQREAAEQGLWTSVETLRATRVDYDKALDARNRAAGEAAAEQAAEQHHTQFAAAESARHTAAGAAAGRRRALAFAAAALFGVTAAAAFAAGALPIGGLLLLLAAATGTAGVLVRLPAAPTPTRPAPSQAREAYAGFEQRLAAATGSVQHATAVQEQASAALTEADRMLASTQVFVVEAERLRDEVGEHRRRLLARIGELQLPADAARLGWLADIAESLAAQERADRDWTERRDELFSGEQQACAGLVDALDGRSVGTDVAARQNAAAALAAADRYEQVCRAAAVQASRARQAEALCTQLAARRAAEADRQERLTRRRGTIILLRRAAERAAVALGEDPAELGNSPDEADCYVPLLERWTARNKDLTEQAEAEAAEWTTRTTLLDGLSTDELAAAVDDLATRARELAASAEEADKRAQDAAALATQLAKLAGQPTGSSVAGLAGALQQAEQRVIGCDATHAQQAQATATAEGSRRERSQSLPPVAEAEEQLADAETELGRVTALADTLDITSQFLSRAQEQVHRDIAPVLAGTLSDWLPLVTDNRYSEARVDPQTLQVTVCGPTRTFRVAEHLSFGTAEQVYLLLRTALTEHLTAGYDSCPLLLDDVTVHADTCRTEQILELLHKLSGQRQVVLFAQQPWVAEWARANLNGPNDKLVELAPVGCI